MQFNKKDEDFLNRYIAATSMSFGRTLTRAEVARITAKEAKRLLAQRKLQDAQGMGEMSLTLEPASLKNRLLLSSIYAFQGNHRQAIKNLKEAMPSVAGTEWEAQYLYWLGMYQWDLWNFVAAKDLLLKVFDFYPDSVLVRVPLGKCYFEMQEFQLAIQTFQEGIAIDPYDSLCLSGLVSILSACPQPQLRDVEKAADLFRTMILSASSYPASRCAAAGFYTAAIGDFKRAIEFTEKGLYELSKYETFKSNIPWIRRRTFVQRSLENQATSYKKGVLVDVCWV